MNFFPSEMIGWLQFLAMALQSVAYITWPMVCLSYDVCGKTKQNKTKTSSPPPFLSPVLKIAQDPEKSSRTESHPLSEPFWPEGNLMGLMLLLSMTSCNTRRNSIWFFWKSKTWLNQIEQPGNVEKKVWIKGQRKIRHQLSLSAKW